MKKRHLKTISLILGILMMAGMVIVPVSAADAELTGKAANDFIKSYGWICDYQDAEDGSTPYLSSAKLESDSETDNSYLKVGFGGSSSLKYPTMYLSSDIVPETLTDYTVKMDLLLVNNTTNKVVCALYGLGTNNKVGRLGFRTGAYTSGKAYGILFVDNMAMAPANETLYLGYDKLSMLQPAVGGTIYTLEMTVASESDGTPKITTKIDGVEIENTNSVALKSSKVGIHCWYGETYGLDNVYVRNDATGEVLYNEDFEQKSIAPTESGKVFAGWYTDKALTAPATDGVRVGYPKFISGEVLGLRTQLTNNTTSSSASTDLRLITSVDGLDYDKVGFRMTYNGVTVDRTSSCVYTSIRAMGEDYLPTEFSPVSEYFATFTLTGIPNSAFGSTIQVTPFWITADGTEVTGETVDITVNGLIEASVQ